MDADQPIATMAELHWDHRHNFLDGYIYIYNIMYIIFLGIRLLIDWFIFKKGSP